MTIIDSSCWIAYFTGHKSSDAIEKFLSNPGEIVVPTLVLYEVYRHLLKKMTVQEAVFFLAQMREGTVAPLGDDLALQAAETSLRHNLATADAVIYATALAHDAKLVTLDNDFRDLPQCTVVD